MNEPTTDDKIQLLVRAVLEAVDSRLDGVRHELAVFAGDIERRHHQVLDVIGTMEQRVDRLELAQHDLGAGVAAVGSANDRIERLQTRLDRLETDAHAAMTAAATAADQAHLAQATHASDLAEISKPLYSGTHVTSQLPIVTDPAIREITSLPIPPALPPTMTPSPEPPPNPPRATPVDDVTDEIDLEQLTNLLNERLGHLDLPKRPEARPDTPPST
jgi:hypothetical protein